MGYVHTDIVSILLDRQGEKPDLDGTTDLEEPGAGISVKVRPVILQMTELLCWTLRLARPCLPVTLAWGPQDQLLHIREQELGQADISHISDGTFSSAIRVGTSST
ncbi:hypothetical protein CB1_000477002 [Camelus ferus]|nr:hypothetical protein CB1_000477002 [Camelus ferus]